jgi:hypothetical protein
VINNYLVDRNNCQSYSTNFHFLCAWVIILFPKYLFFKSIGCSFKFILKVGVEESILKASRISYLNLTSLFALFVFLLSRLLSGTFTIDSSTPTLSLRINLSEHPI